MHEGLAGELRLDRGTRRDEGVVLVERRVASPHVVHGTLPCQVCSLVRTNVTGPRMFPRRGEAEVFELAADDPMVGGVPAQNGIPFYITVFPFAHPFGHASWRLHPFLGN